jgi:hypothetical protein
MTNVRVDLDWFNSLSRSPPFFGKGGDLTYSLFLLIKIRKREAWKVGSG